MTNILSRLLRKARSKRYYEKHKSECLEKMRQYEAKHKEERKEYKRQHHLAKYEENKERNLKRSQDWYQANKEKTHDKVRRRRADKRKIEGGHFTTKEFNELCAFYGNKCLRCGRTDVKLSADHVIPTVFGLPHTDEITNIQPLCVSCNKHKHIKTTDYRSNPKSPDGESRR